MSQVHRAVLHQHPLGSMSLQDMGLLQDSLFLSGKSSLQDTGHKRGASGDCRMFHQGRFHSELHASHEDLTCSVLYILTCKVAPQCFLADSNLDIYKGCGILIRWGSMSHLTESRDDSKRDDSCKLSPILKRLSPILALP